MNARNPLAVVLSSPAAAGRELAALVAALTTSSDPAWDVLALSPTLSPSGGRVRNLEAVICPNASSTFGSAWTLDELTRALNPCLRGEPFLARHAAFASYVRQCAHCRRTTGAAPTPDDRQICQRPAGGGLQVSGSLSSAIVERRCACASLARSLAGATPRLVVVDGHVGELVALTTALFESGVGRPAALLHRTRRGSEMDKLHNLLRAHFMATASAGTTILRPHVAGWEEWHAETAPGA